VRLADDEGVQHDGADQRARALCASNLSN
jgi:hypothetical protein